MAEPTIEFKIIKHIGILSTSKSGWKKTLTLTSWNGKEPKLDVRDWSEDFQKMGKGITFTEEEAIVLLDLLKQHFEG